MTGPINEIDYGTDVDYLAGLTRSTVLRDRRAGLGFTGAEGRRMALFTEDGQVSLNLDIAPREITFDGLTMEWAMLDRIGFVPKLIPKAGKSRTISFETTLTRKYEMFGNLQQQFEDLRRIARTTQRVLVRYSRQEMGAFHPTEASFKSVLRDPVTNDVTRATLSMTLTESNDGPQAGASNAWYRATSFSTSQPDNNGRPRIEVRPGDTLQSVSLRAYGSVKDWVWIYALNREALGVPWADLSAVNSLAI